MARMVRPTLSRMTGAVLRRRRPVGTCSACHGAVFGDEHRMTIRGALLHRRCVAYRGT